MLLIFLWEAILSTHTEVVTTSHKRQGRYSTPRWFWVVCGVLLAIVLATAYPALTENAHQPGVSDFFPEALALEHTWIPFNRIVLARVIVAVIVCLIFGLLAANLKQIPSRFQQVIELLVTFVRSNIGFSMLGEQRGRRYAPLITTIFVIVLSMNLTGVIPGINIAASSVMGLPLVLALVSYVTFIAAGIKERGGLEFFKSALFPPGLPWPVYILITPIEFFSTFIVRPATLAIRLLCNMVSGHLLLAMCFFGTSVLLQAAGGVKALALVTGAASFVFTLFELFVAVLQAYIFAVLTAVYIKLSVESH